MHSALILLDKAIEMGHQELAHLAAGEVDKAEELAFGRDEVLDEALKEERLAEPASQSLDTLLAKLLELKDLQARIIDEATRLKQGVGTQLRQINQEHKRHTGYGRAARPTRRVQSRYISRNS